MPDVIHMLALSIHNSHFPTGSVDMSSRGTSPDFPQQESPADVRLLTGTRLRMKAFDQIGIRMNSFRFWQSVRS